MPTEAEAHALFSLGRDWSAVRHVCRPPANPVKERRGALTDLKSKLTLLRLDADPRLASAISAPKKFQADASDIWARILLRVAVDRGETSALVVQLGAAYLSAILYGKDKKRLQAGSRTLSTALVKVGVRPARAKALIGRLQKLVASGKVLDQDELSLAQQFGETIATAFARPAAVRVGDVRIENAIDLPGGRTVLLPKRLVGYRNEMSDFLKQHPYDRNVFLMMPFRDHTDLLRTKLRQVCSRYKLNLVIADEQAILSDLKGNVLACLMASRYGVAVFSKPESAQAVNPNVAYELGQMHRDDKVCLILKDLRLKKMPSDLIGDLYVEYNANDINDIVTKIEVWITDTVLQAWGAV